MPLQQNGMCAGAVVDNCCLAAGLHQRYYLSRHHRSQRPFSSKHQLLPLHPIDVFVSRLTTLRDTHCLWDTHMSFPSRNVLERSQLHHGEHGATKAHQHHVVVFRADAKRCFRARCRRNMCFAQRVFEEHKARLGAARAALSSAASLSQPGGGWGSASRRRRAPWLPPAAIRSRSTTPAAAAARPVPGWMPLPEPTDDSQVCPELASPIIQ